MYVYYSNDEIADDYCEGLKSADEIIYCSHLDQDGIDDFIHIHACGVHFLSEFDPEFDRHKIECTYMGYLKNSKIKVCHFTMEDGKNWLISPIFCKGLSQLPYDAFHDKTRYPSEEGYISYQKAFQSACIIYS